MVRVREGEGVLYINGRASGVFPILPALRGDLEAWVNAFLVADYDRALVSPAWEVFV